MRIRSRRAAAVAAAAVLTTLLAQPTGQAAERTAGEQARAATAPLTLVTFNRGNRNTFAELRDVVARADAAALQEMGAAEQQNWLDRLGEDPAFVVIRFPETTGAPSTPLVYKPAELRVLERIKVSLLPRQYVGPGAGPDYNKPKWFVGAKFEHRDSGRHVILGSIHNVASQHNDLRREAALKFNRNLMDGLDGRDVLTIVGGDWNAERDDASLAPVRARNWKFTPKRTTHGESRAIDYFTWDDRDGAPAIASLVDAWTRSGNSDHKALYARWSLQG